MVGEFIAFRRKELGMNQEQLAEVLGVHRNTVARWERSGKVAPDRLADLAKALGVESKTILRGGYEKKDDDDSSGSYAIIHSWRNAISIAQMDPYVRLVLGILPVFMDMETGVIAVTMRQLIETAHLTPERVEEVWPAVISSQFVERVGQVEYMFKLRFPEN